MSSRYPILDNRPIDQWKVTELKEELKKRKLTTKGLKDDLIKRLNEALRIEREAAEAAEASEKDEANGFDRNPQLVAGVKDSKTVTVVTEVVNTIARENVETVETAEKKNIGTVEQVERENSEKIPEVVGNESTKTDNLNGVTVPVDVNNYVSALVGEVGHRDLPATVDSASVGEELVVHGSTAETSITITESVSTELVVSCQDSCSTEIQKENGDSETKLETEDSKALLETEDSKALLETEDSKALLETEDSKALLETEDSKALLETEDSKALLETEDSKALLETEDSKPQLKFDVKTGKDLVPESSIPENQVSEVNHSLRSQVKSDSISCDSVSINEKNEFKGNTIADNVKLEQDNIRPEMLEPSPSNFVPVYDESRSMDVGELHEKKEFVEENIKNITSPDFNKTNSSDDVGYPEKLNLDRSSGDDSMEEDLPESKQFDSKFNDDELREKSKGSEVPIVEESGAKAVGEGISSGKNDIHQDNDICPTVTTEKRKFHDQASVGNESAKRQRRWSSPQCTVPATTPKDESIALKCNFSRSDSLATDDAPRDRIVPPSQSSPTTSLRIDRFLRPFTLKAVQELLGKTGKVISFWMDHIKTHCYVTYSSVEEAVETRNTVYNLQWPPNGGRLLVAEFVDPQEVKMKVETPPIQAASVGSSPTAPSAPPTSQPEPSPRQHREQPPFPATLPPPPPLSKLPPAVRERLPSPPPLPEKADPPIVTLDDLFRKTRATPRIYYLPLSEEQVAAKLAAQGNSTKP